MPDARQSIIDIYLLASAQATLSAEKSMGQLLLFLEKIDVLEGDLTKGLRNKRVSKGLLESITTMGRTAATMGAVELQLACKAFNGKSEKAQILGAMSVLSNTLERTRVGAQIAFDLCEAMGIAINGKPLPEDTDDDAFASTPSALKGTSTPDPFDDSDPDAMVRFDPL